MPDYSVRLELQRLRDEHVVLMAEHRYLIESRASVLAPEHLARLDAYLVRLEGFLRGPSCHWRDSQED